MATTAERGKFKKEIHAALYKNEPLKKLILGNTENLSPLQVQNEFKKFVKSHLFIDDTISETGSYIFYDVRFPSLRSNTKKCQIVMYVICHRDILDDCLLEGYYGDRSDILLQMVEDVLINDVQTSNRFGIGALQINSIDIYNARDFYGSVIIFEVPSFR